jgi:hypothetical protein
MYQKPTTLQQEQSNDGPSVLPVKPPQGAATPSMSPPTVLRPNLLHIPSTPYKDLPVLLWPNDKKAATQTDSTTTPIASETADLLTILLPPDATAMQTGDDFEMSDTQQPPYIPSTPDATAMETDDELFGQDPLSDDALLTLPYQDIIAKIYPDMLTEQQREQQLPHTPSAPDNTKDLPVLLWPNQPTPGTASPSTPVGIFVLRTPSHLITDGTQYGLQSLPPLDPTYTPPFQLPPLDPAPMITGLETKDIASFIESPRNGQENCLGI